MPKTKQVYVLGAGAIGSTLTACLAREGRPVVAVHTSKHDVSATMITVTVRRGAQPVLKVPIETVSLSKLPRLEGVIVVAAKSHANNAIATALMDKAFTGPLVIMQNGLAVERPFLERQFDEIYRCVLYATSQTYPENDLVFRPIASSPIGVVRGFQPGLKECVATLTTQEFPFHQEPNIQKSIWKKTIVNCAFNSICPLLHVDNGIFIRDAEVARLAQEIVVEGVALAGRKGIALTVAEIMDQIMAISQGSAGQLISTLQDIIGGRETEIEHLNLEMARIASFMKPQVDLRTTELLGRMILAKSKHKSRAAPSAAP